MRGLQGFITSLAMAIAVLGFGVILIAIGAYAWVLEDEAHPDIDFMTSTEADGSVVVTWAGTRVFRGTEEEAATWIEENPPVREDYTTASIIIGLGAMFVVAGVAAIALRAQRQHRDR